MQNLTQRLIPAYARWIFRWRWPVLITSLLAAASDPAKEFAVLSDLFPLILLVSASSCMSMCFGGGPAVNGCLPK
jgi:hypothetical protein